MLYQQTSAPDLSRVGPAVAELLSADLRDFEIEFESRGYSGAVHRLTARDGRGESWTLLLKGGPVETNYRFFRDVLAPYRLNSPQMYGVIDGGDASYLVMEYIPHEPPDWRDPSRYQRALEWLVYKDATLAPDLARIARLDYLQPFDLGSFRARTAVLRSAAEEQLDARISAPWVDAIEGNRHRFDEAAANVRSGPQTVVHNDFQMLNILFGSGAKAGQLYVVDWTTPAIGSVCIDLATLVHVAPAELRQGLIERFLAACPVSDFGERFAAAQLHVHLSILTWMIDALRSGQAHAVSRPKLGELVESIEQYFAA